MMSLGDFNGRITIFRSLMFCFLITGCTVIDMVEGRYNPLVGTWRFQDPSMGRLHVTYFKNFTYHVDFDGDGQPNIVGHYYLYENRITFHDDSGQIGDICHENGYYHFSVTGRTLTFGYVVDQCRYRASALAVTWEKVKKKGL